MLIDIKDIAREAGFIEKVIPIGSIQGEGDDLIRVGPTKIAGPLTQIRGGVEFAGHLSSSLELDCVRCLEGFRMPVESSFHLLFVARMPSEGAGEKNLREEDCDLYPAPEGRVDIALVAREQLYLSIPLKPLCREDCRGLCPACGENRNLVDCRCIEKNSEPRTPLTIPFVPRRPAQ